jgi:acyl-coenzyme A thioesterase PaaI-like protein
MAEGVIPVRLPGGAHYDALVQETRRLLDTVVSTGATDDAVARAARDIAAAARLLAGRSAGAPPGPGGSRYDLPGRGHPLLPVIQTQERSDRRWRADVSFRRFHVGGTRAVHGGMVSMLFDEILGLLASAGRPPLRTAYLKVDFRGVTPYDTPLTVEARLDRLEGRKVFGSASLAGPDGIAIAEAEALFVIQRPEQARREGRL